MLIAVSTNDALSGSAENIGKLMTRRNIYFVPYRQDAPQQKPTSMVADFARILPALEAALNSHQVQPLILES